MRPIHKNSIFATPSQQTRPQNKVFTQKNPSVNLFSGLSSPATNPWSQNHQQSFQTNLPSSNKPKQHQVNVFANLQQSIPKPDFEQPPKNLSSINLTLAPIGPKVQSPPRVLKNIFAQNPSQIPQVKEFQHPSDVSDRQSNNDSVVTFKPNQKPLQKNKQAPRQKYEKSDKNSEEQNKKTQPIIQVQIKISETDESDLPATPSHLPNILKSQIEIKSEKPQMKSSSGSLIAAQSKDQAQKQVKVSSDPTNNNLKTTQLNIDIRQRQTSFDQILQQSNIKNAISGKTNQQYPLVKKQSIKIQKQGSQFTTISSINLNEVKNANPSQEPQKVENQRRKEEKNKFLSREQSPQNSKIQVKEQKMNVRITCNIQRQNKTEQNSDTKTELKQRVHPEVKPILCNKNNKILSTINERSLEQSGMCLRQQRQQLHQIDANNSDGPSYMDYNSSSHHSYMQNVSSSKKSGQKGPNDFKMTSSNKQGSSDQQKNQIKISKDQANVKELTKSESIERKNEVNVPLMTESLKVSENKFEEIKKEPSSEKKPQQISTKQQKYQQIKKNSIFGRNPIKKSIDKQFKDIVIQKKIIQPKLAESQSEYDSNQQNDKKTLRLQTPKILESQKSPAIGCQLSTIQSLRENARNIRKSPFKTQPKKQQQKPKISDEKESAIFSPVQQINLKRQCHKNQQKQLSRQLELQEKPQTNQNQLKIQENKLSSTEQLVAPGFHRRITFGIDGKETFSKDLLKGLLEQKLQNKGQVIEKNTPKKIQNKSQNLEGSLSSRLHIIQETHSSQKSPDHRESFPSIQKIKRSSQFLPSMQSDKKSTFKDFLQSSKKKRQKQQLEGIKLQLENIKLDLEECNILYRQELLMIKTREESIKQTLFISDGNNNAFLHYSYDRIFSSLYQSSAALLRTHQYLSQIDYYISRNSIPIALVRDQFYQQNLQITEKLCQRIPFKLTQIAFIFQNYQKQLHQEKTLELQKAKEPLKQPKTSFFSLLNLVRNKYCLDNQKKQPNPTPKLKPITQFKSYAKLRNSLLAIVQQKKKNLSNLEERVKICLQQPKRVQIVLLHKQNDKQSKLKTPTHSMNKFRQVLLKRQQRQKRQTEEVIVQKNVQNFDKFWQKLYRASITKKKGLNQVQHKKQLVIGFFQDLSVRHLYQKVQNSESECPKNEELKDEKEKTPIQKYNQIQEIKSKYMRMQQNFIKYQESHSNLREIHLLNPFQKSVEQLQEQRINEKRRLNQQMMSKAGNISVRLRNQGFRLVPFISPKLTRNQCFQTQE